MIKKLLLFSCLLFALSSQVGFCSEATYTMTETELTKLETIFQELKNSNEIQLNALNQSKVDLLIAKGDLEKYRKELEQQKKTLTALQAELSKARNELELTQGELQKVNESLRQFGNEVKEREKKLKNECKIWKGIFVVSLIAAAAR